MTSPVSTTKALHSMLSPTPPCGAQPAIPAITDTSKFKDRFNFYFWANDLKEHLETLKNLKGAKGSSSQNRAVQKAAEALVAQLNKPGFDLFYISEYGDVASLLKELDSLFGGVKALGGFNRIFSNSTTEEITSKAIAVFQKRLVGATHSKFLQTAKELRAGLEGIKNLKPNEEAGEKNQVAHKAAFELASLMKKSCFDLFYNSHYDDIVKVLEELKALFSVVKAQKGFEPGIEAGVGNSLTLFQETFNSAALRALMHDIESHDAVRNLYDEATRVTTNHLTDKWKITVVGNDCDDLGLRKCGAVCRISERTIFLTNLDCYRKLWHALIFELVNAAHSKKFLEIDTLLIPRLRNAETVENGAELYAIANEAAEFETITRALSIVHNPTACPQPLSLRSSRHYPSFLDNWRVNFEGLKLGEALQMSLWNARRTGHFQLYADYFKNRPLA